MFGSGSVRLGLAAQFTVRFLALVDFVCSVRICALLQQEA
jgi:hypothetical protein